MRIYLTNTVLVGFMAMRALSFAQTPDLPPLPPWASDIEREFLGLRIVIDVSKDDIDSLQYGPGLFPWRTPKEERDGIFIADSKLLPETYNGKPATVIAAQFRTDQFMKLAQLEGDPFRAINRTFDLIIRTDNGTLAMRTGTVDTIRRGFRITADRVAVENRRETLDDAANKQVAVLNAQQDRLEQERRRLDEERRVIEEERKLKEEAEKKARSSIRLWEDTSTINGVIRAGKTGSWYVSCEDDRIDDRRECEVGAIHANNLSVRVSKNGAIVLVGGQNYPGSENAIRIDTAAPLRWKELNAAVPDAVMTKTILSQMQRGQKYLIRYYEWPSHEEVVQEGSVDGFREAYEWALAAVKRYPQPAVKPSFRFSSDGQTPGGLPLAP
jgi:hypothetical protein